MKRYTQIRHINLCDQDGNSVGMVVMQSLNESIYSGIVMGTVDVTKVAQLRLPDNSLHAICNISLSMKMISFECNTLNEYWVRVSRPRKQ